MKTKHKSYILVPRASVRAFQLYLLILFSDKSFLAIQPKSFSRKFYKFVDTAFPILICLEGHERTNLICAPMVAKFICISKPLGDLQPHNTALQRNGLFLGTDRTATPLYFITKLKTVMTVKVCAAVSI